MTVIPPIPTNPTHGFAVEGPGDFVRVNESVRVDRDNNSVHPACDGQWTAAPVSFDLVVDRKTEINITVGFACLLLTAAVIVVAAGVAAVVATVVLSFIRRCSLILVLSVFCFVLVSGVFVLVIAAWKLLVIHVLLVHIWAGPKHGLQLRQFLLC